MFDFRICEYWPPSPTAPGTRNPAQVGTGALPGPQLTLNTM